MPGGPEAPSCACLRLRSGCSGFNFVDRIGRGFGGDYGEPSRHKWCTAKLERVRAAWREAARRRLLRSASPKSAVIAMPRLSQGGASNFEPCVSANVAASRKGVRVCFTHAEGVEPAKSCVFDCVGPQPRSKSTISRNGSAISTAGRYAAIQRFGVDVVATASVLHANGRWRLSLFASLGQAWFGMRFARAPGEARWTG